MDSRQLKAVAHIAKPHLIKRTLNDAATSLPTDTSLLTAIARAGSLLQVGFLTTPASPLSFGFQRQLNHKRRAYVLSRLKVDTPLVLVCDNRMSH